MASTGSQPHTRDEVARGWGRPLLKEPSSALGRLLDEKIDFVLARDGATKPVPGSADMRPVVTRASNGEIHCPVPGCGPYRGVVQLSSRHHFRHFPWEGPGPRPGHDSESREHAEAKGLLAHWAREQLGLLVEEWSLDERVFHTRHFGKIKPDLYLRLTSGVQLAFEYQASPGTDAEFTRRVSAYRELGIVCWWLFSPNPKTCRVDRSGNSTTVKVELTGPQKAVVAAGGHLAWFNPWEQRLGMPLAYGRVRITRQPGEAWDERAPRTVGLYCQPLTRGWNTARIIGEDLENARIDPATGHIITAADRRLRSAQAASRIEVQRLREHARTRSSAQAPALAVTPAPDATASPTPQRTTAEPLGREQVPGSNQTGGQQEASAQSEGTPTAPTLKTPARPGDIPIPGDPPTQPENPHSAASPVVAAQVTGQAPSTQHPDHRAGFFKRLRRLFSRHSNHSG